ncbi:hypothetical protein ABIE18_004288 [Arthrobacter sp. 2762]
MHRNRAGTFPSPALPPNPRRTMSGRALPELINDAKKQPCSSYLERGGSSGQEGNAGTAGDHHRPPRNRTTNLKPWPQVPLPTWQSPSGQRICGKSSASSCRHGHLTPPRKKGHPPTQAALATRPNVAMHCSSEPPSPHKPPLSAGHLPTPPSAEHGTGLLGRATLELAVDRCTGRTKQLRQLSLRVLANVVQRKKMLPCLR